MTEALQIAVLTAAVNAAVTWGIISTKLAWLRRDVDSLSERVNSCDAKHYGHQKQKLPSGRAL